MKVSYDRAGVPAIANHVKAVALFDSRPPIKGTDERNPGKATAKNRRMRCYSDGSIGLTYYGTEIIVYHPDGTLTLTALPEQRVNNFASAVLPFGIYQDVGNRTGPILYLGRNAATDTYAAHKETWSLWSAIRNELETLRVVRGHKPVRVQLVGNCWRPVDEAALEPLEWSVLDPAKARIAAREVGIADFVLAAKMVNALEALPPFKGERTRNGAAQSAATYERVLDALEARDYPTAMSLLQRGNSYLGYFNGRSTYGPERIKTTEIARVRTALYKRVGALEERSQRVLTHTEFISLVGALKRFG